MQTLRLHIRHGMKKHILPIAVLAAVQLNAADWPQYRGPFQNGSTIEPIKTQWGGALQASWKTPTPNGFSSFAVADGVAATQYAKDGKETVAVLNAASGRVLWSQVLNDAEYGHTGGNAGARGNQGGDGPRSTPSIDGELLYVFSSDFDLICFNLKDGTTKWKANILKAHQGEQIRWENASSPVVDGDLVIVGGGGAGQSLLAYNKLTGEVVWKTGTETITHATPTVAEIHGTRQVIFFCVTGLVSVEIKTGKILWKQPFKFAVSTAASPIVDGDIVFCSAGYGVGGGAYRIAKKKDAWSSDEIWRIPGNAHVANHWSTPVLKDGHLYGMFSFKKYGDGPLKCVEIATGKIKWEQEGFGAGNVVRVGDNILALTDFGSLILVSGSPEKYQELSRSKAITGKCWSTPTVANGHIFVRSTTEGAAFKVSR